MEKLIEKTQVGQEATPQICESHGEFTPQVFTVFGKRITTQCPECQKANQQAEDNKLRHEEQQRRQLYANAVFKESSIPTRFKANTFETFNVENAGQRRAKSICENYALEFETNYRNGSVLILSGKTGTGKTHLACSILNAIQPAYRGRYLTAQELFRLIRSTWSKNSEKSETQVFEIINGYDLLVIDEIGIQNLSTTEHNIIFDLLDNRYREMKPYILISNQGARGITEAIGDRVFDRLTETAIFVPFVWESSRKAL